MEFSFTIFVALLNKFRCDKIPVLLVHLDSLADIPQLIVLRCTPTLFLGMRRRL